MVALLVLLLSAAAADESGQGETSLSCMQHMLLLFEVHFPCMLSLYVV
jgi:hypothetical protein